MAHTDALDPDKIKPATKRIGRKILVYDSTASTNDIAAEYAKSVENDGLAIFAEQQTAGRGRAGTKWLTGRADSILCSILLTKTKIKSELLSLTAAVAAAEAVGKVGKQQAQVKWPNDILLNNKKAGGILVESKKIDRRTCYIMGIGINCHQTKASFPSELRSTATSINIEGKTTCDRISLAKRLLTSVDHWLEVAEKDSQSLIQRWRRLCVLLNKRVTLIFSGRQFVGNCIGIDPDKGLILQLETGGVRLFPAAHTTIAK